MTERQRPDLVGCERDQLNQVLDYQRATVHLKCEGLEDSAARRTLLPSPLTTIAGVVSHLVWVEHYWMEYVLGGRDDEAPCAEEDPDADWRSAADVPLAALLAEYARRCLAARGIVADLDLEAVPGHPGDVAHDRGDGPPSRSSRRPARADRRRHRGVSPTRSCVPPLTHVGLHDAYG